MVRKGKNFKKYFWIIVAMAFVATSLSFLDRQVLSILILEIRQELEISNVQYGFINTGFLIGYAWVLAWLLLARGKINSYMVR